MMQNFMFSEREFHSVKITSVGTIQRKKWDGNSWNWLNLEFNYTRMSFTLIIVNNIHSK